MNSKQIVGHGNPERVEDSSLSAFNPFRVVAEFGMNTIHI